MEEIEAHAVVISHPGACIYHIYMVDSDYTGIQKGVQVSPCSDVEIVFFVFMPELERSMTLECDVLGLTTSSDRRTS